MQVAEGTATLTGGSATISHSKIRADCRILLTRKAAFGTLGDLKLDGDPSNGSFSIKSANILDSSTVHWIAFV